MKMLMIDWIISRSADHTLEQKHHAWKYLIDHYPDETLTKGKLLDCFQKEK